MHCLFWPGLGTAERLHGSLSHLLDEEKEREGCGDLRESL
jgi:hypothetical protein